MIRSLASFKEYEIGDEVVIADYDFLSHYHSYSDYNDVVDCPPSMWDYASRRAKIIYKDFYRDYPLYNIDIDSQRWSWRGSMFSEEPENKEDLISIF